MRRAETIQTPVCMMMMTSEVFMEMSYQKEPKAFLAQASGVPTWRHLVAVWHANGRRRKKKDDTHILSITVSTSEHRRCSRGYGIKA